MERRKEVVVKGAEVEEEEGLAVRMREHGDDSPPKHSPHLLLLHLVGP